MNISVIYHWSLYLTRGGYVRLALTLMALASSSAHAQVPRMWQISSPTDKNGTTIYILGISHTGTRLEYDEYLENKIVPAFLAADDLYFEDGGKLASNQQPECSQALRDPSNIAILKLAREKVGKNAIRFFRELSKRIPGASRDETKIIESAGTFSRELSEFSVVESLRTQYLYLMPEATSSDPPPNTYPYEPVVTYLRKLRPDISTHSIDGTKDLANAYCSAGERRAQIISMYLDIYDVDRFQDRLSETATSVADRINTKLKDTFTRKNSDLDIYESTFTCPRTSYWEKRFDKLLDGRIHFLALGADHLFPSSGPVSSCQGLLEDLRRSGFNIKMIPST